MLTQNSHQLTHRHVEHLFFLDSSLVDKSLCHVIRIGFVAIRWNHWVLGQISGSLYFTWGDSWCLIYLLGLICKLSIWTHRALHPSIVSCLLLHKHFRIWISIVHVFINKLFTRNILVARFVLLIKSATAAISLLLIIVFDVLWENYASWCYRIDCTLKI